MNLDYNDTIAVNIMDKHGEEKKNQSKHDTLSDLSPTKIVASNTTQGNLDRYLVKDSVSPSDQKQTNSDVNMEILKRIEFMQKYQDANYASQTLLINNILSDQNKTIDEFMTALIVNLRTVNH